MNQEPKPTPGPWITAGLAIYTKNKLENQVANHDPKSRLVGCAHWDDEEQDETIPWEYSEAYANARLMAQAPAMLEGLKLAEQELLRIIRPEHVEAAHAIKLIRGIIERATCKCICFQCVET